MEELNLVNKQEEKILDNKNGVKFAQALTSYVHGFADESVRKEVLNRVSEMSVPLAQAGETKTLSRGLSLNDPKFIAELSTKTGQDSRSTAQKLMHGYRKANGEKTSDGLTSVTTHRKIAEFFARINVDDPKDIPVVIDIVAHGTDEKRKAARGATLRNNVRHESLDSTGQHEIVLDPNNTYEIGSVDPKLSKGRVESLHVTVHAFGDRKGAGTTRSNDKKPTAVQVMELLFGTGTTRSSDKKTSSKSTKSNQPPAGATGLRSQETLERKCLEYRKANAARMKDPSILEPAMRKAKVTQAQIDAMLSKKFPLGFISKKEFKEFKDDLASAMAKDGMHDAKVALQGTSTTFYSDSPHKKAGHHWDADPNKRADFDLTLVSGSMERKLHRNGCSPHPLHGLYATPEMNATFPALDRFQTKWSRTLGRPVNFSGFPDNRRGEADNKHTNFTLL